MSLRRGSMWKTPPWWHGQRHADDVARRPNLESDAADRDRSRFLGKSVVVTQEAGLSVTSLSPASGPMSRRHRRHDHGHRLRAGHVGVLRRTVEVRFRNSSAPRRCGRSRRRTRPGLVGVFLRTADFRWATLHDAFRYLDTTPPQITPFVNGTLSNGWYTSDVTVDWLVYDPDSAITPWCDPNILTTDTSGTTFTCTATSEGGTASATIADAPARHDAAHRHHHLADVDRLRSQ